jgi:Leucine-rich repeat (LRR) protein
MRERALAELPDGAASALLALLPRRDGLSLLALDRGSAASALRQQFFASVSWEVPPWLPFATQLVASLSMRSFITSVSIADPSFEPLLSEFPHLRRVRIRSKHDDAALSGQLVPQSVTHLDLRFTFFESVECLAPLTQLKRLELAFVYTSDFSVISGMSELEELNLWGASIDSISFVAGTPKLRTLNLRRTDMLTDLAPLASLRLLEELNVAEKQLDGLEWLRPLAASLKVLIARELEIAGVGTVAGVESTNHLILSSLTNLEQLEIQNSDILSSFEPIRSLTKLKHLDVIGLDVEDVRGLSAFQQLETLSLDMDESSDWISLHNLPHLRRLNQNGFFASQSPPVEAQVLLEMPRLQALMGAVYLTQHLPLHNIHELSLHCLETSGDEDATAALWCVPNLETLKLSGLCNLENVAKFVPRLKHFDLHLMGGGGSAGDGDASMSFDIYYAPIARLTQLQTLTLSGKYHMQDDEGNRSGFGGVGSSGTPSRSSKRQDPFRFLEALINMEDLYLADQPISDVSVLSSMQKLRRLNLEGTRVRDMAPLRGLQVLEELDLGSTPVVDVSALVGHPSLQVLVLPSDAICRPLFVEYGVTLPSIKKVLHPKINCLWTQHQDGVVDVSTLFEDCSDDVET